jgi:hypothetical protein
VELKYVFISEDILSTHGDKADSYSFSVVMEILQSEQKKSFFLVTIKGSLEYKKSPEKKDNVPGRLQLCSLHIFFGGDLAAFIS